MSFCCCRPRLGTLPRGLEKVRVSEVRFISRTFSLGACGIGGPATGFGKFVCVGGILFGRKMRLRPFPWNVPWKLDKTPNGGTSELSLLSSGFGASPGGGLEPSLSSTDLSWKSVGSFKAGAVVGAIIWSFFGSKCQLFTLIINIWARTRAMS